MDFSNVTSGILDGELVEWHKEVRPQPIHVVKEEVNTN